MSDNREERTPEQQAPKREYEKSGMYPENGKPFRILALLGWLAGVVVTLAAVAALLDIMLL